MRSVRFAAAASALLTTASVTACSGGGAGPSAPNPAPSAAASAKPAATGQVTFTYRLPTPTPASKARGLRRGYLSFATQSFVITFTNGNSAPVTTVVNAENSTCTPLADMPYEQCSTTIVALVGVDTFTVTAYDQTQSSLTPAATYAGNVLGQVTTKLTVLPGTDNTLDIVLNGVVNTVKLVLDDPSPVVGTSSSTVLNAFAYDADGYLIVGSYTAPFAINDSDRSGATAIVKNGAAGATSVTTSSSSDVFKVTYNGAAITATFSGTTSGVTYQNSTLTPASAAPVHPIYLMSYNASTQAQELDGYDLSTQTSVGGSSTQFTLSKLMSARQMPCDITPGYGPPCYSGSEDFSLGPQNQYVTSAQPEGPGTPGYVAYYQAAPIATGGAAAVPLSGPPIGIFEGLAQGQQTGSVEPAVLEPAGTMIQAVFGFNEVGQSAQALQWARFQPGINDGKVNNSPVGIPATATFYLAAYGDQAKFDPQGNLWQFSTVGLQEYRASDVANAANNVALTPITTIQYGTGAGQLPKGSDYYDVSFGANNSVYVYDFPTSIYVFTGVTQGTNSALTATEYFTPNTLSGTYFSNILVDPAGSGNMIVIDEQNQTLDYYYGPGSNAPANGSSPGPYKQVTLVNRPLAGGLAGGH